MQPMGTCVHKVLSLKSQSCVRQAKQSIPVFLTMAHRLHPLEPQALQDPAYVDLDAERKGKLLLMEAVAAHH